VKSIVSKGMFEYFAVA